MVDQYHRTMNTQNILMQGATPATVSKCDITKISSPLHSMKDDEMKNYGTAKLKIQIPSRKDLFTLLKVFESQHKSNTPLSNSH